jgi:hypothetical protein
MADDLQQLDTDEPGITAYHGSPHDFEQFDISKIGTGEGAQAYGHGLYFAENEGVAKDYRDKLSVQADPRDAINDVIYQFKNLRVQEPSHENVKTWMADTSALKEHSNNEQITRRVHEVINAKDDDEAFHSYRELDNLLPPPSKGHMYEVHINAHPDHFLDWDKPFHEQSEHVKRGLRSIPEFDDRVAKYGVLDPDYKSKISMGEFINRGVLPHSYDKSGPEFSNAYHAAGIKGVKYLDQGSRWGGKKNPTSNYVVFDDKLVNVKRKYAKGGTVQRSPKPVSDGSIVNRALMLTSKKA